MNAAERQAADMLRHIGYRHMDANHLAVAGLASLDDNALAALARRPMGLTRTNCWWAEYAIRNWLMECVKNEQWKRRDKREQVVRESQ